MSDAGAILIQSSEAEIYATRAVVLSATEAKVVNSAIGMLTAERVEAESIRAGVVLSRQVVGQVETVLDTPRAVVAGLSAGIALGLVYLVTRLLFKQHTSV